MTEDEAFAMGEQFAREQMDLADRQTRTARSLIKTDMALAAVYLAGTCVQLSRGIGTDPVNVMDHVLGMMPELPGNTRELVLFALSRRGLLATGRPENPS